VLVQGGGRYFSESGQGSGQGVREQSIDEILAAPPSALAALTENHDKLLAQLEIKTVRDLGSNKHFALAGALVALSRANAAELHV
jgi:hypothetical protein